MIKLFSAGTCSDILITCAKASSFGEPVNLTFYTRYYAHQKPISEIINAVNCLDKHSHCTISTKPREDAREYAEHHKSPCITHSLKDRWYPPRYNFKIETPKIKLPQEEYICVQLEAGLNKRVVTSKFIRSMKESFGGHMVAIGEQHIDTDDSIIREECNKSGRTYSIIEAMALIENSMGFIGPNGILAYYAASIDIPCIINFAKESLFRQKMLRRHRENVIDIYQGEKLQKITMDQLNAFIAMINRHQK